eukprot:CAMPEP_0198509050 /NCGR_PEP_ID=MMETSP1462-20131121/13338_1 /TAXON_ID=1333877 /ORGANISM="Brandtodinium nutriculum, Strain RCC3387" /LENGTH=61 /DNA_ID=CAMNT_0044238347 /DNA_START=56 /DNA_END=244 /DNA_ORIENTATION=-
MEAPPRNTLHSYPSMSILTTVTSGGLSSARSASSVFTGTSSHTGDRRWSPHPTEKRNMPCK